MTDKFKDANIGDLIDTYISLRDSLTEERKKFKEIESKIKSDLELIEVILLEKQRKDGVTSSSTENFTAFQVKKKYVRISDWDTFINYVFDSKNTQLLEKRVAKLAALEVMDGERLEPQSIGLEKQEELSIQVRRR